MSNRLAEIEKKNEKKRSEFGAREPPQWVRALAVLVEDRGLVPSTHVTVTTT